MTALRVLLVEDEMLIAMDMEDMLVAMGYVVVGPAMRLQKAVEKARVENLDLAVLDVNLAGERSFPVAEVLRERGIPFIFATGYGTAALTEEFEGTITLQKPVDPGQLRAAIALLR
ncbi:response regulator [Paracoccus rhizosphaerae]|uniref:response regulator n=1 Tax=Paracoccus rhizosphaerae TaxID=1133347 RepID=UPI003621FB99